MIPRFPSAAQRLTLYFRLVRIASLSPAATEILFAMGIGEQIVCTDQFSNEPPAARALPHLRGLTDVDPAALREFSPEIVVLGTSIQEKLAAKLKAAEFSVIFHDPRTMLQIYEWIRLLGAIFGTEAAAQQMIVRMQQGFNDVKAKGALLPRKPKIYIEEWHDPPYASGNWVPEMVKIAGGIPYPVPPGELSPEVSLTQVAAFDPDMIVISWCGAGSLGDPSLLTKRPGWDALRAVQKNQVRVIDDSLLNRPGPRLPVGAARLFAWLFELLH
jgi:iron complex transport system substrate-binding protein